MTLLLLLITLAAPAAQTKAVEQDKWQGPELTSYFIVGITLLNEDAGSSRFNTIGLIGAYNRRVAGRLGVTGDGGVTFSRNGGTDYRKIQLLGGISRLPDVDRRVFLSPHVMAGWAYVTNTFPLADQTVSTHALAVAVGTDLVVHLGGRATTQIRADYNPTFFSGHVQHNLRGSFGLNVQF